MGYKSQVPPHGAAQPIAPPAPPDAPEPNMAMVMIRCPATGAPAFTGIETDASCVNFIPPINARLKCPCCGETHVWSILDAELTAGDPEPGGCYFFGGALTTEPMCSGSPLPTTW